MEETTIYLSGDSSSHQAVLVEISGTAYYTGRSVFTYEPDDLLSAKGFTVE